MELLLVACCCACCRLASPLVFWGIIGGMPGGRMSLCFAAGLAMSSVVYALLVNALRGKPVRLFTGGTSG